MTVSDAPRVYAVLGDPVAHTLSPKMHNAAFAAAGIDAIFVAVQCGPGEFVGVLRDIAAGGGGGSITIPHKEAGARTVDAATAAVHATGACNTVWIEGGRIHGDNTDVEGFARAALTLVESLAGTKALILGAGGGAAAAVRALLDRGADAITLLARSPARAEKIIALQDPDRSVVRLAASEASVDGASFDLVVNATPLGLGRHDTAPFELGRLGTAGAVIDMVYRPGGTRWVRDAQARGIPACDGIVMLVEQGAAAFQDWFGRPAPVDAMRAAVAPG